ncbi:MAG: hypothetical protein H0W42_06015 [Gemmatimonadaceae bacterium]|nr:hypothetical protein [Gemmatimonadaceae bacterium]
MTGQLLRDRIVSFINTALLAPARAPVSAETPLFEHGVLDSLRVLDLIAFVEAEIGRSLPDSAIRLDRFRTAEAIAATALGALVSDRPARDRIWSRTRSRRGAGRAEAMAGVEEEMIGWGRDLGAREVGAAPLIPIAELCRAGYLTSFPGRAVAVPSGLSAEFAVPPAACMHCYADVADSKLDSPLVVFAIRNLCARGDETVDASRGRLRQFTMREIVLLGTGAEVDRARRALMRRAQTYVTRLDLGATIDVATDPFHIPADRGKLALQRLRALKYELRMPVAGEKIAVASFNYHEDYFGRAFGITLPDGSPAHSGCVAFGLERWELALREQLSADAAVTVPRSA